MSLGIFKIDHWKWSYFQIWYMRLNSWGSDGSIDTHIDIVTYVICHLSYMSVICHLWLMVWMTDDRWHNVTRSIWVSKNPFGPQEFSLWYQIWKQLHFQWETLKILGLFVFFDRARKKCAGSNTAPIWPILFSPVQLGHPTGVWQAARKRRVI